MKKLSLVIITITVLALIVTAFASCGNPDDSLESNTENQSTENTPKESSSESENATATESGDPSEPDKPKEDVITLTFNGKNFSASDAESISASGNVLSIVKAGKYRLSGTLDNAQIRVSVGKDEKVELVFAGVNITCKTSAPIYIESADKVSIKLVKDTENSLTDCTSYIFASGEDKPNACLYSSEDLTIKGNGKLTVTGNFNNGIGTKNDLTIESGEIIVSAPNNAIKGNGSVTVLDGVITASGADGIKSDSEVEGKGFVEIDGGIVNITASDDGIQAFSAVTIAEGAAVTVNAADKDVNCDGTVNIAEGALIIK